MSNQESTKACTECGLVKPLDDFSPHKPATDGRRAKCKPCIAARQRERYHNNPEKYRAKARRYKEANRDRVREDLRSWRERNQEHVREYQRRYRADNAEYLRAEANRYYYENRDWYIDQLRQWREANRDYWRTWLENNQEKAAEASRQRRYRQRGAEGYFTEAEWIELCAATGDKCLACECTDLPLTRDHVIPLVHGGTNCIENIQPLCRSCNSSKGARYIDYRGEVNGKA